MGAVISDQPALLIERCMKCGDVAESDKKFGIFPDRLKIDEIQQTRGAITSSETEDGADRRIGESSLQIPRPQPVASRQIISAAAAGRVDHRCQTEKPDGFFRFGQLFRGNSKRRSDERRSVSWNRRRRRRRLLILFLRTAAVDRLFDFRR